MEKIQLGGCDGTKQNAERLATSSPESMPQDFYKRIAEILKQARKRAYSAVNYSMVLAYWKIGESIVGEQGGADRAAYGDKLIEGLSERLTADFGKGFTPANLRNMRQFYIAFPICDALRSELSWTHYRKLMRVDNERARTWYMNEAANEHWSTRQLDRQISVLYYERLLASRDKAPVVAEAHDKLANMAPEYFIKDPYVLNFLDLKDYPGCAKPTWSNRSSTTFRSSFWSSDRVFALWQGKNECASKTRIFILTWSSTMRYSNAM